MIGLVPVTFGAFCLNYTSIPLYLAFRRCGLLSTVIVTYLWESIHPSKSVVISTGLVTAGAIIAASENIDANLFGFLCVWAYNFSQSFQNVYISVLNKGKALTPFEFNFFFVCTGLLMTSFYNFVLTSDYKQIIEHSEEPHFQATLLIFSTVSASLSLSIAIAVAIGGPVALNVTGILKDVFLTYAGFMFFDETEPTLCVLIGLALSFAGAIKYVHSKFKTGKKNEIQEVNEESNVTLVDDDVEEDIESPKQKRD